MRAPRSTPERDNGKVDGVVPRAITLIVLDLNMPIMDGYEACRKIRQAYEDLARVRKKTIVPLVQNIKKIRQK